MVDCRACARPRPHKGRGLCASCYTRHERGGSLDQYPRVPRRGRPRERIVHGTSAGWWKHRRRGEAPCPECAAAKRADDRADRRRPERLAYQREYQPAWRRRQREGRVTVASVIRDVVETVGTSMSWLSLSAWVLELHPEWSEATVRRTLTRMVGDGRICRVEFGEEVRYRLG